jgi:hypothetical protein
MLYLWLGARRPTAGTYTTRKTLLGFNFNGNEKTMWLEAEKWEKLLTILKGWI